MCEYIIDMAESQLRCWTRYANDGHRYISCEDGTNIKMEKKKLNVVPRGTFDRQKAFMEEMSSAEKELEELMAKDELDALLRMDRFATPIDREERSSFQIPSNATSIDEEVVERKATTKPLELSDAFKNQGWTIQRSSRPPFTPYYFNTRTGQSLWFPPTSLERDSKGRIKKY